MRILASAMAIAGLALAVLGLPASASAVTYTVNSTGDAPDKSVGAGGCETATASECTLRAAIEEANDSENTLDVVFFSTIVFDGEVADSTIALGSDLPKITDQIVIGGGNCDTDAGVEGPCVGVNGPAGGF